MVANVESMMFYGQTPWHGLGEKLNDDDLYNIDSAIPKAGLDWQVELVPLQTADDSQPVEHRAVRRSTDKSILGVVGPKYHVLQNIDAFKWFSPFLEARQAQLHTAGSLANGSRVWVLAKLNLDPMVIAKGDEVEKFAMLAHAHDGSLAVRIGFTRIRVVCSNTLGAAMGSKASKLIRVRHSSKLQENLENIREVMDIANQEFEATAEQYRLLVRKDINQKDLKKYVKLCLGIDEEDEISTRSKNIMESIFSNFEQGRGSNIPSVKGTLWAAYNAYNEWLGYERGHNQSTRLNSLWFGESAKDNDNALKVALEMAA